MMPFRYRGPFLKTVGSAFLVELLLAPFQPVQACATCGCTLSTDAAMGYSTRAGWRVNLKYDYINQDQLRHGTGTASAVPIGNELEHKTTSHYVTAGVTYAPNRKWNVGLQLPYVIRDHTTYGAYDPSVPLQLTGSHSASLGDARLVGSYQGFLPTLNLGVQLGVKLPTGRYGESVHFDSGPDAGQPLDASLQPGTGSTDLIVGAYYYQAISQNFDAFANGRFQTAVQSRAGFRPGNKATLSVGLRYEAHPVWIPQLQINLSRKSHDQGPNADVDNTAGTVIYLSPGLSVNVIKHTQFYGFVQVPVYQNLDGWQLAPRWTASVGVSRAF